MAPPGHDQGYMASHDDSVEISLTECEREPIHIPGTIQPFGVLLTVEPDSLRIHNASENCLGFWGISAQDLIGKSFDELLLSDEAAQLRHYLHQPNLKDQSFIPLRLPSLLSTRAELREIWNLSAHKHLGIVFLELERVVMKEISATSLPFHRKVREVIQSLQQAKSLKQLCDAAVREVRSITGFDRVMLYRFDPDFNGQVISEAASPSADSYLDHHFPASDIPSQARAIFLQNWLRMIPHVGYSPSRLYPGLDPVTHAPLDLSQTTLRSVSPIHLEYLTNMKVKATLTISLLDEDKLWGLIACHHEEPLLIDPEDRLGAQLIGQIVSSQLRVKEALEDIHYKAELKNVHARLLAFMQAEEDLVQGLVKHSPNVLDIATAQGAAAAINFNGEWTLIGTTPSLAQINDLVTWLAENHSKETLFQTDSLSRLYPDAYAYRKIASGLLAIAILKTNRNYLLWFRPEVLTTVVWAGNPEKSAQKTSGTIRLNPRTSFESWEEAVTGTAVPWKKVEIEVVEELRNSITALDLERQFTQEQNARALAENLARHDFLTKLPNRLLLNDRIAQAIILAQRHGTMLALLFLDLDHFKHINDSLGHAVGDKLLQSVAQRLCTCVRKSDTVSRQGGDEFVILVSEDKHAEDAALTADKILAAFSVPHSIDGHELHVTTSIGISTYPADAMDAETLIKNADTAMYQSKEKGRNNYQFFQNEMNVRAVERHVIESNLRHAMARQEFELHYQPKVHLDSGTITGAEALLRWKHPELGLMLPERFVPIAEDCGLIVPIGRWVLQQACAQAKRWEDEGLKPGSVAVNVSALEFARMDFVEGVRAVLNQTGLAPCCLQLEITESVLMRNADSNISQLQQLKKLGVQLAVDDFGTGYSSLSYLNRFPIDVLKIDQSFVHDINSPKGNGIIVSAIIAMGTSLKQRVVAEGVEELDQLAFLKEQHCEEGQGYLFSQPLAAERFSALLSTGIAETILSNCINT